MRVRTLRLGRWLSLGRAPAQGQQRANRRSSNRDTTEDRRRTPFATGLLRRLGDRDRRGRIACRHRAGRAALGRARLWSRLGHWLRRRGGDRLVRNRHGLRRDRLGRQRGSRCRLRRSSCAVRDGGRRASLLPYRACRCRPLLSSLSNDPACVTHSRAMRSGFYLNGGSSNARSLRLWSLEPSRRSCSQVSIPIRRCSLIARS
jgi:hypothetical protein